MYFGLGVEWESARSGDCQLWTDQSLFVVLTVWVKEGNLLHCFDPCFSNLICNESKPSFKFSCGKSCSAVERFFYVTRFSRPWSILQCLEADGGQFSR